MEKRIKNENRKGKERRRKKYFSRLLHFFQSPVFLSLSPQLLCAKYFFLIFLYSLTVTSTLLSISFLAAHSCLIAFFVVAILTEVFYSVFLAHSSTNFFSPDEFFADLSLSLSLLHLLSC
jgi:hypothetical protein